MTDNKAKKTNEESEEHISPVLSNLSSLGSDDITEELKERLGENIFENYVSNLFQIELKFVTELRKAARLRAEERGEKEEEIDDDEDEQIKTYATKWLQQSRTQTGNVLKTMVSGTGIRRETMVTKPKNNKVSILEESIPRSSIDNVSSESIQLPAEAILLEKKDDAAKDKEVNDAEQNISDDEDIYLKRMVIIKDVPGITKETEGIEAKLKRKIRASKIANDNNEKMRLNTEQIESEQKDIKTKEDLIEKSQTITSSITSSITTTTSSDSESKSDQLKESPEKMENVDQTKTKTKKLLSFKHKKQEQQEKDKKQSFAEIEKLPKVEDSKAKIIKKRTKITKDIEQLKSSSQLPSSHFPSGHVDPTSTPPSKATPKAEMGAEPTSKTKGISEPISKVEISTEPTPKPGLSDELTTKAAKPMSQANLESELTQSGKVSGPISESQVSSESTPKVRATEEPVSKAVFGAEPKTKAEETVEPTLKSDMPSELTPTFSDSTKPISNAAFASESKERVREITKKSGMPSKLTPSKTRDSTEPISNGTFEAEPKTKAGVTVKPTLKSDTLSELTPAFSDSTKPISNATFDSESKERVGEIDKKSGVPSKLTPKIRDSTEPISNATFEAEPKTKAGEAIGPTLKSDVPSDELKPKVKDITESISDAKFASESKERVEKVTKELGMPSKMKPKIWDTFGVIFEPRFAVKPSSESEVPFKPASIARDTAKLILEAAFASELKSGKGKPFEKSLKSEVPSELIPTVRDTAEPTNEAELSSQPEAKAEQKNEATLKATDTEPTTEAELVVKPTRKASITGDSTTKVGTAAEATLESSLAAELMTNDEMPSEETPKNEIAWDKPERIELIAKTTSKSGLVDELNPKSNSYPEGIKNVELPSEFTQKDVHPYNQIKEEVLLKSEDLYPLDDEENKKSFKAQPSESRCFCAVPQLKVEIVGFHDEKSKSENENAKKNRSQIAPRPSYHEENDIFTSANSERCLKQYGFVESKSSIYEKMEKTSSYEQNIFTSPIPSSEISASYTEESITDSENSLSNDDDDDDDEQINEKDSVDEFIEKFMNTKFSKKILL